MRSDGDDTGDIDEREDDRVVVPCAWGPAWLLVHLRPGGFGQVFVATLHEKANAVVVLKRMRPTMKIDVGEILDNVRRLQGRSLPGVTDVLDAGATDGFIWVATRYVEGVDLQTLLDEARLQGRRVDVDVAVGIALGLLRGLSALHGAGLVHRDVTPANVLVGSDGTVTLVDVDFVVPVGTAATDAVPGTPSCMSPEQAQGLPVDGRADLLAWGIVATTLLTGEPFYADLGDTDVWRLARVGGYRPNAFGDVPPPLQVVLARALAPDPVDRFVDVAATRAALVEAWPSAASVDVGAAVLDLVGGRLARMREVIGSAREAPRPLPSVDRDAVARVRGAVELKDGYTDPFRRMAPPRDASASVMRPRSAQGAGALVVVVLVLAALAAVLAWRVPAG